MPLAELAACARGYPYEQPPARPQAAAYGHRPVVLAVFLTSAAISGREHARRRLAQLATRPLHERCLVRNLPAGRVDAEVSEQS